MAVASNVSRTQVLQWAIYFELYLGRYNLIQAVMFLRAWLATKTVLYKTSYPAVHSLSPDAKLATAQPRG